MTAVAVFAIDDPADPRLQDYRNVPDPELLNRCGVFVAEGRLVVRRLLSTKRWVTRSVMVTAPALASVCDVLPADVPAFLVPQHVVTTVTGFNIHRGCLAIGERGASLEWRALAATARTVVVLERVANADNVGGVFRNAAAFAAGAVLLGPDCADPLYRKSIRTSMASALAVPFASLEPWPDALRELRATGIRVLGLSPRREAPALRELAADAGPRVALVAGHEGEGLTREAMEGCDAVARIPMPGEVDSLNVATAVGIALYEIGSRVTD